MASVQETHEGDGDALSSPSSAPRRPRRHAPGDAMGSLSGKQLAREAMAAPRRRLVSLARSRATRRTTTQATRLLHPRQTHNFKSQASRELSERAT